MIYIYKFQYKIILNISILKVLSIIICYKEGIKVRIIRYNMLEKKEISF